MQVHVLHLNIYIGLWVVVLWATFQTSKVLLSTKCKMYMWGNEIRIFHANVTKSQGPTMYTSTTVCSLCIVKLQQRHSELVNGAITSNNMSYLTKTLSHCHWMCFTSNKEKKCFVRASCAFSSSIFLSPGVSLKSETCSSQCLQSWLHLPVIWNDLQMLTSVTQLSLELLTSSIVVIIQGRVTQH